MSVRSFRDLDVWKDGILLVEAVYALTRGFPKAETFALASQLQRSAVSIPSNIAEGHSRQSTKEFQQFISIAVGSLAEVETQLEIAMRLGYSNAPLDPELAELLDRLGRKLSMLQSAIRTKTRAL